MPKAQERAQIDGYKLNARADMPDIRDWRYEPALIRLRASSNPPSPLMILDQGTDGACTGFGLAAVINCLNRQRSRPIEVAPRMLYEMAKLHDEWEGEDYSGSSCRGAIKGWHNMGVCKENDWPYAEAHPGHLTLKRAKLARENTIGAYYRVQRRVSDFHAALNEVGALYVCASIHSGWRGSAIEEDGTIPLKHGSIGGHAFAAVGYSDKGFWVQNSWGSTWGNGGLALWTYEDWLENIKDAWVLRLALPTPQIWHLSADPTLGDEAQAGGAARAPNRAEIAGHFVHIDDGRFHEKGKYWSTAQDVQETADLLEVTKKYDHLLLYAHGGLNSINASARRVRAMKEVFKDNRIYPFHFMYDTGLMEELKDVVFRKRDNSVERTGGFSDASDWLLQKLTRIPGRALWREMKRGAKSPFRKRGAGSTVLRLLLNGHANRENPLQIHLAGHSTGAILLAHLLDRLATTPNAPRVSTVNLLAPASTIDLFEASYRPLLTSTPGFGIDEMHILGMDDRLERNDNVGAVYRKSLLYLVSRAFEEKPKSPLLGMQRYNAEIDGSANLDLIYSKGGGGAEGRSESESHGGFDNDEATMNHILRTVLNGPPLREFTKADLEY